MGPVARTDYRYITRTEGICGGRPIIAGTRPRAEDERRGHVHGRVARGLRLRGFDVLSAHETARLGLSDDEQLAFATSHGRTLVSFNTADYVRLHVEWLRAGRSHHGILVSDQVSIGETLRRLLNVLNRVSAEEIRNQLLWLQAFK